MSKRWRNAGLVVMASLVLVGLASLAIGQMMGRPFQVVPTTGEPPLAAGVQVGTPTPSAPARPGFPPSDPPTPQVSIRVRVPADAHPGKELEYRFLVQNPTTAAAHHVRVRTPVPTNSKFLRADPPEDKPSDVPGNLQDQKVWTLGTMAGGSQKEIRMIVEPNGAGDLQCCARVQFEHGQCVKTTLTQPELSVRIQGPTQVLLNDTVRYVIEVSNTGKREATSINLAHTLPEGLVFLTSNPSTPGTSNPLPWGLGALLPGQSKRIEIDVSAKTLGTQVSKTEVTDGGKQKVEKTFKTEVVEPKLDLIVAGPHRRLLGRPAIYQITVSNPGTAPANDVTVWSILPAGIELVGATGGGQVAGSELRWRLGTLVPGGRQTLQAVFQSREGGEFDLWVHANAARLQLIKKMVKTKFEGAASLNAEVDVKDSPLEVGKTGTCTLRLVNGGSKEAKDVVATLTLPDELRCVGTPKGNVTVKQEGQKVIVGPFTLAANSDATVTMTVEALKPGEVRLHYEVTSHANPVPIHNEEPLTLYNDKPAPAVPRPPGPPPP